METIRNIGIIIVGLIYTAAWAISLWFNRDLVLLGFQLIGIFIVARFSWRKLHAWWKFEQSGKKRNPVLAKWDHKFRRR